MWGPGPTPRGRWRPGSVVLGRPGHRQHRRNCTHHKTRITAYPNDRRQYQQNITQTLQRAPTRLHIHSLTHAHTLPYTHATTPHGCTLSEIPNSCAAGGDPTQNRSASPTLKKSGRTSPHTRPLPHMRATKLSCPRSAHIHSNAPMLCMSKPTQTPRHLRSIL